MISDFDRCDRAGEFEGMFKGCTGLYMGRYGHLAVRLDAKADRNISLGAYTRFALR